MTTFATLDPSRFEPKDRRLAWSLHRMRRAALIGLCREIGVDVTANSTADAMRLAAMELRNDPKARKIMERVP